MLVKITIYSFLFLLANVESSLQTSIVLDRSTAHSAWLFKIGALSLADYVLLFATIFTIARIILVKKISISSSPYFYIIMIMVLYLFIGILYNITVFYHLKSFLFDLKVVLWLIIPFLFLLSVETDKTNKISIINVFVFLSIGKIIDFLIVQFTGVVEYPSLSGLPVFPSFLPAVVVFVGIGLSKKKIHKTLFSLVLLLDLLNAINRLSLGVVFDYLITPLILMVFWLPIKTFLRYILLTVLLFSLTSVMVFILYNPIGIVAHKSDGANTRVIATENFWANAQENIPGVIGKGLGSTYFDRIGINKQDVYSFGTSMGESFEESAESDVLFIMHGPMGPFYKWGLIGYLFLIFLIVRSHNYYFRKLSKLRPSLNDEQYGQLFAELLITSWFLITYIIGIGQVNPSLVTSLLVYIVHRDFKFMRDNRSYPRSVGVLKNQRHLPCQPLSQCV